MATTSDPAALSTAYSLSLLSEYTQNLDSLPADVSRQFADLRELDAVLSASVHALTSKINRLIDMIETNSSPKEQRIWLLVEIAEEAQRLKLGGEDKIRVAAQVADGLKAQNENMTSLLLHIPGFNPSILSRHTVYPHISPRSYAPISMYENNRRRRGALLAGTADPSNSSNKRRRAAREDDVDPVGGKTPRRERNPDANNSRSRNGARSRKFVKILRLFFLSLFSLLPKTFS
jgi:inhibitor of growth protein 3